MGRQNYSVIGHGMNYAEALRNARAEDISEHGHEEGYNGSINSDDGGMQSKCLKEPKIAKKCTVESQPHKGTRKWITVYQVEPRWERNNAPSETVKTSQGDALKKAKELSLKHNAVYVVTIAKVLESGTPRIAIVTPTESEMGQWKFWGQGRS